MEITKEWIENKYIKEKKTQREIATEANVSQGTIYNYMKKYNIESREQYRWNKDNHPMKKDPIKFKERSRENMIKMQQRKQSWKNEIKLTKRQREIILGSLLGDMTICLPNKCKTPWIGEEHSEKQREYLEWKQMELKSLINNKMTTRAVISTKGTINAVRIQSMCMPCLSEIEQLVRKNGHKRITTEWLKQCGNISLAVWMMDDGSSSHGKRHQFNFAIGNITNDEITALRQWLLTEFDIKSAVREPRQNNKRLEITGRENLQRLYNATIETIREIPSMMYKTRYTEYTDCNHKETKNRRCISCGRFV